jgi:hypothetical protein
MSSKNPKENAKEVKKGRSRQTVLCSDMQFNEVQARGLSPLLIKKDPKLGILEILNFLNLKIPNTATKMKGR